MRLYYAVRDGLLYDPYSIEFTPEAFKASTIIARGRGFCVAKACVLAAAARALRIPARLGFADVRNHLATERLRSLMGTDIFYYHGYTELYLEGKWVKATPAFNIELCRKFGTLPLEFDGRTDSIFHPFDAAGRRHMEYVTDRGNRADLPFEEIRDAMLRYYPQFSSGNNRAAISTPRRTPSADPAVSPAPRVATRKDGHHLVWALTSCRNHNIGRSVRPSASLEDLSRIACEELAQGHAARARPAPCAPCDAAPQTPPGRNARPLGHS